MSNDNASIMAGKRQRDNLLQQIVVKVDQATALTKHKYSASECNENCTYLQRRMPIHKQQILIDLLLVKSKKPSLNMWLGFIKEDFIRLKLEQFHLLHRVSVPSCRC
jgi:hypothetical protein